MWHCPGSAPVLALLALFLLPIWLGACFRPDLAGSHFSCDTDADCPPGFACTKQMCAQTGTAPPTDDLGTGRDLMHSDLLTDLREVACTGESIALSAERAVYACRGHFASGGARDLCGTGFHLCTSADSALLNRLNQGVCDGLSGFFASDIPAGLSAGKVDCQHMTTDTRVLVGCGSEIDSMTVNNGCDNLDSVISCATMNNWKCTKGLDDASHLSGTGGVLCCKG